MTWFEIHRFDQDLTLAINSWTSSISDPIWVFFSKIPVWIPLYVAIVAFLIARLGWKKGFIVVAAAALTFAFCDQSSNFIKALTERLRPCNDPYMIQHGLNILEKGGSFSFFSAHSANAFGLATSTYIGFRCDQRLKYRGYACGMYAWASLVAISRVFVGKHFLGDVIVGICIGLLAGWVFGSLAKMTIKRFLE